MLQINSKVEKCHHNDAFFQTQVLGTFLTDNDDIEKILREITGSLESENNVNTSSVSNEMQVSHTHKK